MTSQTDVREVSEGKEKPKRRFDSRDFNFIADYIVEECDSRKQERHDLDRTIKEIDRQLAMEPDIKHKLDAQGRPDVNKAWMPETELPLQAETLEILVADAASMIFPDSGLWFQAQATLTDEYLERVDFQSLITGDQNEVPSQINQDNADKLVAGVLDHWHRQYDFRGHINLINAEAFKYGAGVGRGRVVTKEVFLKKANGIVKETQRIPILIPRSIKNTYLDKSKHALMSEGFYIGPSTIFEKYQKYEDLVFAANRGSSDPEKEDGGWMPKNLKNIHPNDKKDIRLLEFEGDLVVPRKTTGSIYIPGALVTVVVGNDGSTQKKSALAVVRFRFRKYPFSSDIVFPYHTEHQDTPYPTSPLRKGWPIQKAAVEGLNQLFMSGALKIRPPTSYDKDDMYFAQHGGPIIFPGAQWGTTGTVTVHDEVGGEPAVMLQIYTALLMQYANVTGMLPPRFGAQTISHTTRFAKQAELNRGAVRTAKYVKDSLKGPLTQWLYMAFQMGRDVIKKGTNVYIEPYDGFVTLNKEHLPDEVIFTALGTGTPQEEQARLDRRLSSMQMALGLEQMRVQAAMVEAQTGLKSHINIEAAQEQVLREGGWNDLDSIIQRTSEVTQGAPEVPIDPGAALDTFEQ